MRILIVVIVSLFFINCGESQNWGNGIKADGNIITKSFDLDKFTGVVSAVSGNVMINPGAQKFAVTASANIIEVLELKVKNGVLHIGFEENVKNVDKLDFDINIPAVHYLGMTGSGKMKVNGFDQQPSLDMRLTGSGSINTDNGADELTAKLSGSGGLHISGRANNATAKVTGSGTIHAKELSVNNLEANITGSGGIDISCTESLTSNITGSGSIDVYGSPKIKSRVTGSGKVREHN